MLWDCWRIRKHLVAYADGELDASRADEARRHLDSCERCARVASEYAELQALAAQRHLPATTEDDWEEVWSRVQARFKRPAPKPLRLGERRVRLALRPALAFAAAAIAGLLIVGLVKWMPKTSGQERPSVVVDFFASESPEYSTIYEYSRDSDVTIIRAVRVDSTEEA